MRAAIFLHIVVVAWLTILPLPIGEEAVARARMLATYDHNAVPIATLELQLTGGLSRFELRQWIGNLLLLLPLGIYGPIRWPALRAAGAVVGVGAAASAAIELGQLGLAIGYGFPVRVADVDDVLLNTAGVVLGWAAWRVWTTWRAADAGRGPSPSRATPRG
jgi:glycopeptide antibiotics resistance protein